MLRLAVVEAAVDRPHSAVRATHSQKNCTPLTDDLYDLFPLQFMS